MKDRTWLSEVDTYMTTWQGNFFHPEHISELDVDILDIAHALSGTNRYCGHLNHFYSVAQHSVIVANLVGFWGAHTHEIFGNELRELKLSALLHDASEAYMPDMPSPVKALLPDFKALELEVEKHIFKEFDLPFPLHPLIKKVDTNIRGSEVASMSNWVGMTKIDDLYKVAIEPLSSKDAEEEFLDLYVELTGETLP